ncbi:unnamed protein product [Gadus morhua 'NCC']
MRIGRLRIRAVKCNMCVAQAIQKEPPDIRVKSRINRAVRNYVKNMLALHKYLDERNTGPFPPRLTVAVSTETQAT